MAKLTAGETLTVTQDIADAVSAELRVGGAKVSTHALTASGTTWTVNVDTSAWPAGNYVLQVWATFTDDTTRIVGTDRLDLSAAVSVGDPRSLARISFDNIKLMLAGQAKEGVKRYKINNRELERYTVSELLALKSHFAAEVIREERRERGRNSLAPRILAQF
jgi:hypothetical protein